MNFQEVIDKNDFYNELLEDRETESRLCDWDYYWTNNVSKKELEAIKTVSSLLRDIARYHDCIGFEEIEAML